MPLVKKMKLFVPKRAQNLFHIGVAKKSSVVNLFTHKHQQIIFRRVYGGSMNWSAIAWKALRCQTDRDRQGSTGRLLCGRGVQGRRLKLNKVKGQRYCLSPSCTRSSGFMLYCFDSFFFHPSFVTNILWKNSVVWYLLMWYWNLEQF